MNKTLLPLCVLSFLLLFFHPDSYSQVSIINGKVTDKENEPLADVSIIIKGSDKGTVTKRDGTFSLNASLNTILIISRTGYITKEVTIHENGPLVVSLQIQDQQMDEVVVIGYGTMRKKDLTGAVSVVDKKAMEDRALTTIAEGLQGAATGVYIRGGGLPGSTPTIEIRGISSLTNNNPLYVIDGLPTDAGRDINPADIESIQILKDASAAAIYGSRAANGVIIVTTKKGKEGPVKINLSALNGVQSTPRYDLMDATDFITYNNMAYANAGLPPQNHRTGINTDWQDETFQTGMMQNYNANFSGGTRTGNYFISAGYLGNKGTVIGTDFKRYNFQVNTEAAKGIFKIGETLSASNAHSDEMAGNAYWEVLRMLPTIPVYDSTNPGGYGYGDGSRAKTFGSNPVALNDFAHSQNENFRVRGTLYAEVALLKWLTYKINLGYETSADHYTYLRKTGNWTYNQASAPSALNENRASYISKLMENTLSFYKTLKEHVIDGIVGITWQKVTYSRLYGSKNNLLQNSQGDYYPVMDAANMSPQIGGYETRNVLNSYLGRLNYRYKDKYLLTFTVRRDGSSQFAKDNRWGTFPSVSGAWKINHENFFNVPWINDLKFRANWGSLGSVNIGSWDYSARINNFPLAVFNNQIVNGAIQTQLANPDLKWETVEQSNFGIDATFLKGRLNTSIEYYIATSRDVLYRMNIPLSTGNAGGNPVVNAASLQNTGFEMVLNWKDAIHKFRYNITANLTTVKNKLLELGYNKMENITDLSNSRIGQSLGMWYLIKTEGLFQSVEEINNYKNKDGKVIQPDAKPGDIRFVDYDGDGSITTNDRQIVASPWPKFEIGLNSNISWKGFDLMMNWFASFGQKVFNAPRQLTDRFDDNSNYRKGIQPWTPDNPNTNFPRVVYASTLNSLYASDRWLENGTFVRLRQLTVGYSFNSQVLGQIGIDNCRIYFSGQNLLVFTKYLGLDPEFQSTSLYERGRDSGAFPNLRTISAGIQFGL